MTAKADFRAMREGLGLTQQDVALALGVKPLTVKRWENPGNEWEPPAFAWDCLDEMEERRDELVAFAVEKAHGSPAQHVVLTYYRSHTDYSEHGRDEGPHGFANACAREVAGILRGEGYEVEFAYPENGAIATPGSNY